MTVPIQDATVQTIMIWRADSISLARLRPSLIDLMTLSVAYGCETATEPGGECETCLPCRLRQVTRRMEGIT